MNFFSIYKRNLIYFFKKKINIDLESHENTKSLDYLFEKYGTDKARFLGKKRGHGYTKFYLNHFNKLKKKKNLKILEIGSYSGASAAAFSKFFPNSKIFCLDINLINFKYYSKNIYPFGLDAKNLKYLQSFFKKIKNHFNRKIKFDIIIDDGSHHLEDILKFLNIFFSHLNQKGYYVIEEYKFPNFFPHLSVNGEPKIDKLIKFLKKKKYFKSNILDNVTQKKLHDDIAKINYYKGYYKHSSIVFFKKK